jgi:hypothetical protein
MTVSELIAQLKTMPQEAKVIVRGYEDGVNEADQIMECRVVPWTLGAFEKKWGMKEIPYYYGLYEFAREGGEEAVFIRSTRDDERG